MVNLANLRTSSSFPQNPSCGTGFNVNARGTKREAAAPSSVWYSRGSAIESRAGKSYVPGLKNSLGDCFLRVNRSGGTQARQVASHYISAQAREALAYQEGNSKEERALRAGRSTMGLKRTLKANDELSVIKAPSDKRTYEVIHLKNGLAVILIHDPLMAESSVGGSGDEESDSATEGGSSGEEEDGDDDDHDDDDADAEVDCCFGGHHIHAEGHSHPSKRSHVAGEEEEVEGDVDEESDGEEGAVPRKSPAMAPNTKAAAAMCVGVGSFADPSDAMGLAHFLEHMLFMGSRKFPDENDYDVFLSKHGGESNAFTDTEITCYHFDVNHNHLKAALDRFSQFFISPLAKADAMDREVQAIDSEFDQVSQSDSCRLLQLQCHTANPKHPFNTFSWGNKKSLGIPMAEGIDIRGKMLELYKNHYFAGRMKLAVLGGEPLETMKKWVTELFGEVGRGQQDRLAFPWAGPVWEKGKLYRVESVKDQHLLSLIWPFPCLESAYLKKPHDYVSHLVGHEGAGSLLSLLKEKGWATGLSAGVGEGGYERSSAGYMFSVNVNLTVVGLEEVLKVIDLLYQYIKMLRQIGPQDWVFQELQAMGMMEFKFAEEESANNYVVRLASNMHIYTEEHIVYGDYAFEEWDAKLVNQLLSMLTPENMRVDVLTKRFDRNSSGVEFEPWFEVPYTVEVLPEELLKEWADPASVNPALHMPVVNEFIPRDFSIRTGPPATDGPDVPRILLENSSMKIWYKLDKTFTTPRANAYISVALPALSTSLKANVLTVLYVKLVEDALNETLYLANVAKLESSMLITGERLELKLFGFSEKLPVLAQKIAEIFQTFVPKGDRFQAMKEDLERIYRNTNMKPLKHSAYLRLQILKERVWHVDEKLGCLLSLTLQDVLDFIPQLFEQSFVEALCHGNLSEKEALNTVGMFKDAFVTKDLPANLRPKELVYELPLSPHVLNAEVRNKAEDNSVVEMYFQVEQDLGQQSLRTRAILDIFEEIVYEPCFNQLRTKEQLGYRVDCGVRVTHRILGYCFRVQSSKYSPLYLHHRINTFIETIPQIFANMSSEEYENYKEALIAAKLERDHSLIDESERHWEQIWEQRYLFEARKMEAMEIQTIKKNDVLEWFSNFLGTSAPHQKKLSIHLWGSHTSKSESNVEGEVPNEQLKNITDISAFKSTLKLYPAST